MRKVYSESFKADIVRQLNDGVPAAKLSKKLQINQSVLFAWKRKAGGKPAPKGVEAQGSKAEGRFDLYVKGERAQLLQVIGELTIELRKLKGKA